MLVTPTAVSSVASGAGIWTLFWSGVLHLDPIAKLFRVNKWVSRDNVLGWVNRSNQHRVVTLLGTEAANIGMHGLSSANTASYVLGGTLANCVWIWGIIPVFQAVAGRKKRRVIG